MDQISTEQAYVKDARKQNKHVILLDSGGSLAGSLAAFYYAVVAHISVTL